MLVLGLRYRAWIPIRFIMVETRRRPPGCPAHMSIMFSILAPPNGCSKSSSSIQRINANSSGDTGVAWKYAVARASSRSWHCRTIGSASVRSIIALRSAIPL